MIKCIIIYYIVYCILCDSILFYIILNCLTLDYRLYHIILHYIILYKLFCIVSSYINNKKREERKERPKIREKSDKVEERACTRDRRQTIETRKDRE